MIPDKIYLSSDQQYIETYANSYFIHLYYSKGYSDSKFDRAIEILKGADPREMSFRQWELISNVLDFLEAEDE